MGLAALGADGMCDAENFRAQTALRSLGPLAGPECFSGSPAKTGGAAKNWITCKNRWGGKKIRRKWF